MGTPPRVMERRRVQMEQNLGHYNGGGIQSAMHLHLRKLFPKIPLHYCLRSEICAVLEHLTLRGGYKVQCIMKWHEVIFLWRRRSAGTSFKVGVLNDVRPGRTAPEQG